jgi:hypothetical protein
MKKKVTSVLELARYKAGQIAFWVALRTEEAPPVLPRSCRWMMEVHPKIFFDGGPYRKLWPSQAKLPKLHAADFNCVVGLLRSQLVTEEFLIHQVIRSTDTGEFYYSNPDDEWMPESYLFDTEVAARKEQQRVMRLMRKWANS